MIEPLRDDKPINLDDSVCFDELGRVPDCGSHLVEPPPTVEFTLPGTPHLKRRCDSSQRELLRCSFPEWR